MADNAAVDVQAGWRILEETRKQWDRFYSTESRSGSIGRTGTCI